MRKDIFKDMSNKLGCMYISDLPSSKDQVEKELFNLSLEQYSKEQICEFCDYVFGSNSSAIKRSLKSKTEQ